MQSENTVIRISIERNGYERQVIELTAEDSLVSVELVEIPVVSAAAHFDDPALESIAGKAYQLNRIRDDLLAALAPWAPIEPAEPVIRGGNRFLVFRLNTTTRNQLPTDSDRIADRAAAVLVDREVDIDGVLLSFERRVRGGISSSVGTRFETDQETACER